MVSKSSATAIGQCMRELSRRGFMMPHAVPLVLLGGLLLAGCANTPSLSEPAPTRVTAAAPSTATTGPVKLVPVTAAAPRSPLLGQAVLLLPEEAAPVKTVRERHHVNGTRQEIVLDTGRQGAGEGVIDVSVLVAPARAGRATDLQLHKPTEDGIRNEIIGRFPDVKMSFVTRTYTNAFGNVGIAIGRHASGATCVFAWQWIDDLRAANGSSGIDRFGAALTGSGNPASVRIRLCRRDQTADQVVAHIEQLQLGKPEALQRLTQMDRSRADGSVQPVDDKGVPVAANGPLRPVEGSLESMLPPAQAPKATAAAVATAPVASEAPRRRVARGVPRSQEWRNQPASLERSPQPERSRETAPADTRTGRRFLAPVQAAQVQGAPGVTELPLAPPAQTQRPGADLPPEAFRGPTQQQPRTLQR